MVFMVLSLTDMSASCICVGSVRRLVLSLFVENGGGSKKEMF